MGRTGRQDDASYSLRLRSTGLLSSKRFWNIGAEGQLIVGALAGGVVALQAGPDQSQLYMIWVLLAAMAGGALYGAIVAWLKRQVQCK